jgi:hypothetical protein
MHLRYVSVRVRHITSLALLAPDLFPSAGPPTSASSHATSAVSRQEENLVREHTEGVRTHPACGAGPHGALRRGAQHVAQRLPCERVAAKHVHGRRWGALGAPCVVRVVCGLVARALVQLVGLNESCSSILCTTPDAQRALLPKGKGPIIVCSSAQGKLVNIGRQTRYPQGEAAEIASPAPHRARHRTGSPRPPTPAAAASCSSWARRGGRRRRRLQASKPARSAGARCAPPHHPRRSGGAAARRCACPWCSSVPPARPAQREPCWGLVAPLRGRRRRPPHAWTAWGPSCYEAVGVLCATQPRNRLTSGW